MNTIVLPSSVLHRPANVPDYLIIWQDENSGIKALVDAAQDMIDGKIVTFALCHRQGTEPPQILEIVRFGMGSDKYGKSPRYCGEEKDPNAAGSHALIPGYYDYATDRAAISAALSRAFKEFSCYFRMKE